MKYLALGSLLASACLLSGISTGNAAAFEDRFDNGLSNWTASGDVALRNVGGNNSIFLTTAYTTEADDAPAAAGAFNLSGNDPLAAGGALETAAGLPVGSLDLDAINQATEGSVLSRTFTVTAGEKLEFDWQLYTNDTVNLDYLFVSINGACINIASVGSATIPGSDYALQTTLLHFEYTFTTSGAVNIAIGVTDVGDYASTTSALVDNVRVSAVPEPGVVSLVGVAALGVFATAISRRRKSTAHLA